MTAPVDDPFAVLGLAPTLDAAAVRRAWMQGVKLHPPHSDPDGFRRMRAAYERLGKPDTLREAWLQAPFDPAAELARYDAQDAETLAQFQAEAAANRAVAAATEAKRAMVRRFGQVVSGWTLEGWRRLER